MATHRSVDKLIEAARRLPAKGRARLIRALTRKPQEPPHHITELRGLGKEVWQGFEAQEYINAERDAWES